MREAHVTPCTGNLHRPGTLMFRWLLLQRCFACGGHCQMPKVAQRSVQMQRTSVLFQSAKRPNLAAARLPQHPPLA